MLKINYQQDGFNMGQLSLKRSVWLMRLKAIPSIVSITPNNVEVNNPTARYISTIYREVYGAEIQVRYPLLLSLKDQSGHLLAAVGIRPAASEPLFLEQYLEEPIEQRLNTSREKIVEIGNLASSGGGASMYLFAALSAYLHHQGYTKAVVTCTDFLEKRFKSMGLEPCRLASANPSLLLHEGENWGSYYKTDPHVLAGSIDKGYRLLQRFLDAEFIGLPAMIMVEEH